MIMRFKHFKDSLNIILILAPDREFFCASVFNFL